MRIALLDTTQYEPTTPLFLEAVIEQGHDCLFIDEAELFSGGKMSMLERIAYHGLGRRPWKYWQFNRQLTSKIIAARPDVFLVVKGAYLSPDSLREIKRKCDTVLVNFATDDPFNPRNSTKALRDCIPLYDLYACTKRAIMEDVQAAGCRTVGFVPFGFKPSVHFVSNKGEQCDAAEVDVAFI